jgi:hypothetical protein
LLSGIQERVKIRELIDRLRHKTGLREDCASSANILVSNITDCKRDQVAWDWQVLFKAGDVVSWIFWPDVVRGDVGAHVGMHSVLDSDAGSVGVLDGWSVLQRSHRTAINVFTLAEHVGLCLVVGLIGVQPGQGHRVHLR